MFERNAKYKMEKLFPGKAMFHAAINIYDAYRILSIHARATNM
jgi:hypothetical protein